MSSFDERLAAIRHVKDAPLDGFAAGELAAWIHERARGEMSSSAAREVLRRFPVAWWRDAIVEMVRAQRTGTAATRLVGAALELEPSLFDDAPALLVPFEIGRARTTRLLAASPEQAIAGLEALFADSSEHRWDAAGYLSLLDPSDARLDRIARALGGLAQAERWDAHERLGWFGLVELDGALRRLWPTRVRHFAFERGYAKPSASDVVGAPGAPSFALGGLVRGRSPRGESVELHHLITLDPVPPDLGIRVAKLVLATSLDHVHDEGSAQFHRHAQDGTVSALYALRPSFVGERMSFAIAGLELEEHPRWPAIRPTRVQLVDCPALRFQDWGGSNGEESLFRLGGLPVFVQSPSYPKCLDCSEPMVHLLSLDSQLPLVSPDTNGNAELWWGSGGVANLHWCDRCLVSAISWACT